MSAFYTYFSRHGNNVLYRGYDESGKRVTAEVPYKPSLYIKSNEPAESDYKSMYGYPLVEKQFESMSAAKDFCKTFETSLNIHGNSAFEYDFIHRSFKDELQVDISKIKIAQIDIETETEFGFPNIEDPNEVIQLVSFMDYTSKKMTTYGIHPSTVNDFVECVDEVDLLTKVVQHIMIEDPDILVGWNSIHFDGAVLFGRIEKILGKTALSRVSPFGKVYRKVDNLMGREQVRYEIVGRVQLDMLDLYKKFRFVNRPNYKLGYIGEVEVGETKLENPYKTFKEHYVKDWNGFVEYNQQDVRLVDKLEAKLGLVYLAVSLAYMTKVNFDDVYSPVKLWENYIKHSLLNEDTFCPVSKQMNGADYTIEGGYVAKPKPGGYGWSVAFDATSLYPSIIMSLNMSPETLVGQVPDVSVDALLGGLEMPKEFHAIDMSTVGMAANGALFSKDKPGILARLTKAAFDNRKLYKKEMLKAKTEKERLLKEMSASGETPELMTAYKTATRTADRNHVMQLAVKTLGNSGYGALANKYFMFFDNRIAEGITMTGQYGVRRVNKRLDEYMKENFDPKKHYSVYADTDSTYLLIDEVVNRIPSKDEQKICDAVDKWVKLKLDPVLQATTDDISRQLNFYSNGLQFKREAISTSGFWLAPKKYALRVLDNEGVRYSEPDYKVTGIETNRSSTPDVVRGWLMETIERILNGGTNDDVRGMIEGYHRTFMKLKPHDIAFPRSANNLREYSDPVTIYTKQKACPIAVRASLLYNNQILKFGLQKELQKIEEGDKIKFLYLKTPNTLRENVIAFTDKLPTEFGLDKYVDYQTQFEKVFLDPLTKIMDALGWTLEEQTDLSEFFG